MVGGSELAFRLLCRRHGADLCYTPMLYSGRFAADAAYRAAELQTCAADAPLVAHFCGNDPATLLAAAKLAEPHCVAVDLNLGCPQRVAHTGHFGSYLMGLEERPLVLSIVRTLATSLRVPLFCKIRLQDELQDTLTYCRQLKEAP
jgi:tRNA-dihydrouridine synthase 1